jgi:hypothetical protein
MRYMKCPTEDRARSCVVHSDCDVALREEERENSKRTIFTYREEDSVEIMDAVVGILSQHYNFTPYVCEGVRLLETWVGIPINELLDTLNV